MGEKIHVESPQVHRKEDYNLDSKFYADETMVNCKGRKDRFWCCLDWDTRLITGVHYSLAANPNEAKEFLKKAIAKELKRIFYRKVIR